MLLFRSVLFGASLVIANLPANAATLKDISYELEFAGHSYFDVRVYDVDQERIVYDEPRLDEAQDEWGLPRLFPAFAIGDRLTFSARFSIPDSPSEGQVMGLSCQLGPYDCSTNLSLAEYDGDSEEDSFDLFYGDQSWFRGTLGTGESLLWDYLPGSASDDPADRFTTAFTQSGDIADWFVWRAEFTVQGETPQTPSAVPLPASALLLPIGLAGLASLRRRKMRRDPAA